MKRFFFTLAFVFMALCSMAQGNRVCIRDEVAENETNNKDYTIFTYTWKDGTFGYYLGLGAPDNIPGSPIVFDEVTETCIYLGASATEALAMMDTIISCFNMGKGVSREFPAAMAVGRPLMHRGNATCYLQKLLFGKRLAFRFTQNGYTTETFLIRSGAKMIRSSFKFNARKELKNND